MDGEVLWKILEIYGVWVKALADIKSLYKQRNTYVRVAGFSEYLFSKRGWAEVRLWYILIFFQCFCGIRDRRGIQ